MLPHCPGRGNQAAVGQQEPNPGCWTHGSTNGWTDRLCFWTWSSRRIGPARDGQTRMLTDQQLPEGISVP